MTQLHRESTCARKLNINRLCVHYLYLRCQAFYRKLPLVSMLNRERMGQSRAADTTWEHVERLVGGQRGNVQRSFSVALFILFSPLGSNRAICTTVAPRARCEGFF